jgi:hypothetical protein
MIYFKSIPGEKLNIWQAVLFMIVHEVFFGLYLGSIVAPNHNRK